ncbi:MAG: hypothetical protein KGZ83_12775 [Sulfuricella sp.]|nr:hypothetical protein [Sulfuricella sp.]
MAKTKPDLSAMIPDSIRAFADGARAASPVPQPAETPPPQDPVAESVVEKPAPTEAAPPVEMPPQPFIREGKTQVQLRLPPSVQSRLRRMAFERSEMSPSRVTVQELLERAVMQFLEREEKKSAPE